MGALRNCSCIILSSQWQVTLEIYLCVIVTDFHSRGRPLLWSSKTCLHLAGQKYKCGSYAKYYNLSMLWRRSLKDCRQLQDVSRVAPCLSVGCPKAWPETQDLQQPSPARLSCPFPQATASRFRTFYGTLLKPSHNTKVCCISVFNGLLLRGMVITVCMNTVLPNTWRLIT